MASPVFVAESERRRGRAETAIDQFFDLNDRYLSRLSVRNSRVGGRASRPLELNGCGLAGPLAFADPDVEPWPEGAATGLSPVRITVTPPHAAMTKIKTAAKAVRSKFTPAT
jgi:hypothetical protein